MTGYILRRFIISIPLLFLITLVTFLFMNLAPGDPIDAMIDPEEMGSMSAQDLELERKALGLDKPVVTRYFIWLRELTRGNFGFSYHTREPVLKRIRDRLFPTLELTATALVISTILGTMFGVISALRQYSIYDYTLSVISLFGVSIPTFFLALAALYIFAAQWPILPAYGMGRTPGGGITVARNLYHLLLPATVLSLDTMAGKTRYARTAMLEVMHSDYVRTARAKGLPEKMVIWRHAFRNALLPIITLTTLRLPHLFGGAVLIETMFSWPGLGQLSVRSVSLRDYPVLMGLTFVIAMLILASNLLADILYAFVDPRIRVNK